MFLPPLSHSLRKPKLVQRRRNTCPSAQDISRALQSPSSTPSASAASLDELIQRCLNCFGQSVFPCRFARVPKFVMCLCSLSQPGYINEGGGRERVKGEMQAERNWGGGTKGSLIQSSFVLLGCRGQLTVPRQCETIQISLLCLAAVSLLSFDTSSESQTICVNT